MAEHFSTHWKTPSAAGGEQLTHINNALSATLDPRAPAEIRQEALRHLEAFKSQADAPYQGFTLAEDWNQNDAVRYYGLQLLEFAVKYRWADYSPSQTAQLRRWIQWLAASLRNQDAAFIRNKIAQLWVEAAKRSWGADWMDMDQQLFSIWARPIDEKGTASKIMVLYILELLNEEVMISEDPVAGLRQEVLGGALNEIMIPDGLFEQHILTRGTQQEVRHGPQGWLSRICELFTMACKQMSMYISATTTQNMETCALRALSTLRPTMSWISLKAAEEVDCVDSLFQAFLTSNVALQTAAVEVLHALVNRQCTLQSQDTWTKILRQAMQPSRIATIRQAFERTYAAPGEDEEKYTLHKKMSELLAVLGDALTQRLDIVDDSVDLASFLELLLLVLQSKSLTVSIPALHSWTKLIVLQDPKIVGLAVSAFGALLELCSERLLRYDALPEEVQEEVIAFLSEDFDTVPERHAFLGNYRRYCNTMIEQIARSKPMEALSYTLGQMRSVLQTGPYTFQRGFESSTYSKASLPVLKFDTNYNAVVSTLRGYSAWTGDVAALHPEDELHARGQSDLREAAESLEQWCRSMVDIHTDDPGVAEQVLEILVFVLKTLKRPPPSFVLHMVQHLLTMQLHDNPAHAEFSDGVKVFEGLRVMELQRVAVAFPNDLLEVYRELEPRVFSLAEMHSKDQRLSWGYRAFLFMIIQRAGGIEHDVRMSRLQAMLKPAYEAWSDPSLGASVASLQDFCRSVGLEDIAEFYKANGFHRLEDWSAQQLDANAQAKQNEIKEKSENLPLRMTKSMLSATTDKLKPGTDEYENACALWGDLIPVILPNMLRMLRQAQAFCNMANWSQLPNELQQVIKRTLQDRFWQSGISNESKQEFYARISGSKTSYEGFASTVRGTIRNVREQAYHIVYLMTKFDEQFYGFPDLADPLADGLFADAGSLSANHLHPLINLTTGIVQRCPPHHRARFLPPLLIRLFVTLDSKISAEWETLERTIEHNRKEDDDLGVEMRSESILRQLTYSMVSFVPLLLDFDKNAAASNAHSTNGTSHPPPPVKPTLADLVLSNPALFEPMIMFCMHTLSKRDTRCCQLICRVFRGLLPLFAPNASASSIPADVAAQVREFICTEVLKACITSLHEPYFADMQKDLAALIAQILVLYAAKTDTPREVLLSLPEMGHLKVDRAIAKVCKTQNERSQRALVLDLLEGVRGVSIHEAGKIPLALAPKSGAAHAKKKGGVPQQYMEVETKTHDADTDLDGVASMFGEA